MSKYYLKNGKKKTVVLIGDSGAGKSESLEALRMVAGKNIVSMQTVFDDMGTFKIEMVRLWPMEQKLVHSLD